MKNKGSVNASRHPYLRDDLWAKGYFDFLWRDGISDEYRNRLNQIKFEAMQSKQITAKK